MEAFDDLKTVMEHFSTSGAFLTVRGENGNTNTMTISWGFIGELWASHCFMVFVRPQRFTQTIIQNAKDFTVSVPFGTMSEQLKICGTQSGRDTDKSKVVEFLPSKQVVSPIVAGCDRYFECLINSRDVFKADNVNGLISSKIYPQNDYHHIYIGEIVACY